MSDAVKKAEELRQSAIAMLLDERGSIEEKLRQFGWGEENGRKRGRPPKEKATDESVAETQEVRAASTP